MKAVLGLKLDPWHDTGAAIVLDDGRQIKVAAISQERINRVKHSRAFPAEAITYCLNALGLRLEDINLVVADYIMVPGVEDCFPGTVDPAAETKREFFQKIAALGIPGIFAGHHLCHAASAFYCTDWDEAAGLVIDGHGSKYETQTIYHCRGNTITTVAKCSRPSIGWMYCAVTEKLLGFEHLQDGKTMGLAGWAKNGGNWSDLFKGTANATDPCEIVYPQFVEEGQFWKLAAPENFPHRRKTDDPVSPPFSEYAYAAQAELETGVMQLVRATAEKVPSRRLSYSGGVALNILANRQIIDSGLYDDVFIQPAASDSGIPLGAALYGYHCVLQGERRWKMEHAFLGCDYSGSEFESALQQWAGSKTDAGVEKVARILANDYLVAWYQGASEFGPRALGHRSILCLPRHPQMKAYLNREVKHREMFRPFAPIVPEEKQAEYFDLNIPSPYMLINSAVRPHIAPLIPAIVHADGTARVESISRSQQPELHALLNEVGSLTGISVLLNTSLNLAGEPIVETPADAVDLFARSRLDALVLGPYLLTKVPLQKMLETPNPGPQAMEISLAAENPPVALKPTPLAQAVPFESVELDLWLDEQLTVCGERRTLVAGPGATRLVGKLLARGVDAWGVDTLAGAAASAHGGRCVAGTLADLPLHRGPFAAAMLPGALDDLDDATVGEVLEFLRPALTGALHVCVFKPAGEYRDRSWWEQLFFAAGFRKHPLRHQVQPLEQLETAQPMSFFCERIAPAGERFDVTQSPAASPPDSSRITGRRGGSVFVAL